jgi:ribosome-associated toxin RatA of RatAB toxin-antitoxin module
MPSLRDAKTLPYPLEKVFAVALDLERLPQILPYVKKARVVSRSESRMTADLTIGLSFVAFTYRCKISYDPDKLLEVSSDDKLFRRFRSACAFERLGPAETRIFYQLDAEFANPVLEIIAAGLLPFHAKSTLQAFERYLDRS